MQNFMDMTTSFLKIVDKFWVNLEYVTDFYYRFNTDKQAYVLTICFLNKTEGRYIFKTEDELLPIIENIVNNSKKTNKKKK